MSESYTTYAVGEECERPWGRWKVLDLQPHVVVKKIAVNPGSRISLQRHQFRSERWIVTEGVATARCGDAVAHLTVGESIIIPAGTLHRLANETDTPLTIIEIQQGSYLSETDIERFNDDYGRGVS